MLKDIGLIVTGLVVAGLFTYLRGKILTKVKDEATEKIDWKKFRAGAFRVFDPVCWIKDLVSIFNIRKIMIYLLIATVIYGAGTYRGKLGKPVNVNLSYEKEFHLKLDGTYLHKPKNSKQLEILDAKGNKIKDVTVGDVQELRRALAPYGFILKPYFSFGMAITDSKVKQDVGIGVNWLKWFKWRIGNWLSNNGIWLGVDYKLTDNFGVGLGIGKGYKGDNLLGIRGIWNF